MPPAPPVRPQPRPYPPRRGRVTLALEELERREVLSPVVIAPAFFPGPPQTPEGASIAFAGGRFSGGSTFATFDLADTEGTYTADLIATRGTVSLDAGLAGEFGVGVANNDTARVTLTGRLTSIDAFLGNVGYTFTPDAYFSGDATLALSVPDPAGLADGYAEHVVQVLPVVEPPNVSLDFAAGFVGPGPVVFAPGSVFVGPWDDADGSETVSVAFGLFGGDATQFTLTAGGAPVALDTDFLWVVTAADAPTLQALLDTLVLTPPAGFRGSFALDVMVTAEDFADFPSTGESAADDTFLDAATVPFRYFAGGAVVTVTTLTTTEGQSIDLGGRVTAVDPDDDFGDVHTVTLSAPAGTFTFSDPAGSFAASVTGSGTNTLTVSGSLADIADVLATPGALTFDPPAFFAGELPLAVTFDHQRLGFGGKREEPPPLVPFPAPTGVAVPVRVAPVASFPAGGPMFEVPPLVPVGPGASAVPAGLYQLFDTPDADGSESLSLVVEVVGGATPGFVLAAGGTMIPRQADGTWILTAPDAAGLQSLLDALTLTPAGGLTGLGYSLEVTLVVTDAVSYPSDGTTATDVSSRTFSSVPLDLFAPDPEAPTPPVIPPDVPPTTTSAPVPPPPPPAPKPEEPAATPTTTTTTTTSKLPPPGAVGVAPPGAPAGPGTRGEGGPAGGGPGGPGPAAERPRPEALAAAGVITGLAGPEPAARRADPGAQAATQTFARAEPSALPTAMLAAERHPLPPVLPLDSSAPVAGFTDSGGDSLALLDELLREVAPVSIPIVVDARPPARADEPPPAGTAAGPTAWAAGGDATAGGGGWPFDWLAAGLGLVVAGWAFHGRGVGRWCSRAFARLFPPPKELA